MTFFSSRSIAILSATPPAASGVAAAVYNCALQTGSATGVAIVTSIQTSVQISHGGPLGFQGRAAGLWFIVAFVGVMGLAFLCAYKDVEVNAEAGTSASVVDGRKEKVGGHVTGEVNVQVEALPEVGRENWT